LKLSLEVAVNDGISVVTCKGRIVYRDEVAALSNTVDDLLTRSRLLVLELSEVETLDGAGLGELAALLALARDHGCRMKLVVPNQGVRDLLELTRLESAFDIHRTLDDALAAPRVFAQAV
jgi:anti-sigma B factor antagonist